MKFHHLLFATAVLTLPLYADSVTLTTVQTSASGIDTSLANEAKAAIDRGTRWLLAQQNEDGHWSNEDFPALTGLPLWALVKGNSQDTNSLDKAIKYILSCVHDNGSICREPKQTQEAGGGLCNYNTAICMVALNVAGRADLISVVQKARQFMAGSQHFGSDLYNGGMGYDEASGRPYADLSNSYIAYEAMRLTENVEDLRKDGDKKADLDWDAAKQFIQRVQNLPGSNDQPWASADPNEKGGFAYGPDSSKAGSYTDTNGVLRLRSYGSMTYAGLLSLIYAQVDKNDPRVQTSYDWAVNHWTLSENPGMGDEGLYYFYNVLSKALAAHGDSVLTLKDGSQINWRVELIKKLISIQKIDAKTGNGYWVNEANRWWEADPVLVTSYALLALEVALGQM